MSMLLAIYTIGSILTLALFFEGHVNNFGMVFLYPLFILKLLIKSLLRQAYLILFTDWNIKERAMKILVLLLLIISCSRNLEIKDRGEIDTIGTCDASGLCSVTVICENGVFGDVVDVLPIKGKECVLVESIFNVGKYMCYRD